MICLGGLHYFAILCVGIKVKVYLATLHVYCFFVIFAFLLNFLHDFYTLLILADVLVVLISQCFQPGFYAVFRNSGFALSTMIIRIALAAPPFFNVLLGIAAAVFAILLTIISNKLFTGKKFQSH